MTDFPSTGRVGLAIMRMQPPHRGHISLISRMMQDCDVSIVAFGSSQNEGVARHPFSYAQRVAMVRHVLGNGFAPMPLPDIAPDASNDEWMFHVLEVLKTHSLPAPTDYYTGSPEDAAHYTSHFADIAEPFFEVGLSRSYRSPTTGRCLHIIDRELSQLPAAQDLRVLIEAGNPAWQAFVPTRLVSYIDAHYPRHLLQQ